MEMDMHNHKMQRAEMEHNMQMTMDRQNHEKDMKMSVDRHLADMQNDHRREWGYNSYLDNSCF